MNSNYYIQTYSHLKNDKLSLNGEVLFQDTRDNFSDFIRAAYRELDIKYPKFFKMDNLSKLAFVTADVLLNEAIGESKEEQDIAIVLSNKASSLDTDRRHQKSIEKDDDYFPSPAVFVYTLPNICIGEISIKHRLFSENSFFIFDDFRADCLWNYADSLLRTNKANKVLCGWVDFDKETYESFLYLVSEEGNIEHNIEEIQRLYTL